MFNLTPVVKYLLIINILVHFLLKQVLNLPPGAVDDLLGYHYIHSELFKPFQAVTYMFVHGDWGHIFGNMLTLFFFGPMLEQYFGQKRFLIFYLVTGWGAGFLFGLVNYIEMTMMLSDVEAFISAPSPDTLLVFLNEHFTSVFKLNPQLYEFVHEVYPVDPNNSHYITQAKDLVQNIYRMNANIPMVGASGAIFGIIMAFGMLFPNLRMMLLFPPIPIRAKYMAIFWGLYSAYNLIYNQPGDNVAHLAHLGGMVFAFFLIKKWDIPPVNM